MYETQLFLPYDVTQYLRCFGSLSDVTNCILALADTGVINACDVGGHAYGRDHFGNSSRRYDTARYVHPRVSLSTPLYTRVKSAEPNFYRFNLNDLLTSFADEQGPQLFGWPSACEQPERYLVDVARREQNRFQWSLDPACKYARQRVCQLARQSLAHPVIDGESFCADTVNGTFVAALRPLPSVLPAGPLQAQEPQDSLVDAGSTDTGRYD